MGLFGKKKLSEEELKFHAEFEPEEKELIVLVKEDVGGGVVRGDFVMPNVRFIASIDPVTDQLSQEGGLLQWMIPRKHRSNDWGFKFKKMNIYKVLVRKCYRKELKPYQSEIANRRFMAVKVISSIKSEARLDAIREEYIKPVYIEDGELGRLTLDRTYGWFEGEISWLGTDLTVYLAVDESNDSTANTAYETMKKIASDIQAWDDKLRKYAAEEMTELANDWNEGNEEDEEEENSGPITKEVFARRIDVSGIHIHDDGSFDMTYNDDDMFFGHWVVVHVDENGKCDGANLEG